MKIPAPNRSDSLPVRRASARRATFAVLPALVLAGLLPACASRQRPPAAVVDPKDPAAADLVEIATIAPRIRLDLRYASADNFTGVVLYPVARAYLRRDAAVALSRVQDDLQSRGLGLKVFDAYRPLSVQRKMWRLVRDSRYVSNPAVNAGRHTRGTAVDVTLVDRQGRELPMPTGFDDFSERAHRGAAGVPAEAARNSRLLEEAMKRHGFVPFPYEWWHFDLAGWEDRPPLDIPLDALTPAD